MSDEVFWKLTPRAILHRFWYIEYVKIKEKEPAKGDDAIKLARMMKGLAK